MNSWEGRTAGDGDVMPKKYIQRGRLATFSERGGRREERVAGEGNQEINQPHEIKKNPCAHWTWQICRPCFRHIPIHIHFCIHIHVHIYIRILIYIHLYHCVYLCMYCEHAPCPQAHRCSSWEPFPRPVGWVPVSPWSCPLGMIQLRGAATWEVEFTSSRCEVQTNMQNFMPPFPQCVPTQKPGCFKCYGKC